jgi:hypothetical protein
MGLHTNGRLLALSTNIRLGWKWIAVANTLAYCFTATITAIKGFIAQAPGGTAVEHETYKPKDKGLNPATGTWWDKMVNGTAHLHVIQKQAYKVQLWKGS